MQSLGFVETEGYVPAFAVADAMNRANCFVPNIPFIAGLGGEDITAKHIFYAIEQVMAQDGNPEKHETVWLNREVQDV